MTIKEMEDRVKQIDDRSIMLFKKYPLVGASVFLVGVVVGIIIGKWAL